MQRCEMSLEDMDLHKNPHLQLLNVDWPRELIHFVLVAQVIPKIFERMMGSYINNC